MPLKWRLQLLQQEQQCLINPFFSAVMYTIHKKKVDDNREKVFYFHFCLEYDTMWRVHIIEKKKEKTNMIATTFVL